MVAKSKEKKRTFRQASQLEHVKLKPNSYIGSISLQTIQMYVADQDNKIKLTDVTFSPGLLKIMDEIIVNACDHYVNFPEKVTTIEINYNSENGECIIRNDGPGIDIEKVKTIHDGDVYKPQAIFSQFLSGDNFEAYDEDNDKTVGGSNGLGSKCTNAFSDRFIVSTYDKGTNKSYYQEFHDGLTVINTCIIIDNPKLNSRDKNGYTEIKFIPSYSILGYKNAKITDKDKNAKTADKDVTNVEKTKKSAFKDIDKKYIDDIVKLIKMRAVQTAAFLDGKCKVFFNGEQIIFGETGKTGFRQFAELFVPNNAPMLNLIMEHPKKKKLNIDICLSISGGKLQHSSIINGISVYDGGSHIEHIINSIVVAIKPNVDKILDKTKSKFNKNVIVNNLFLIVKFSIVNAEFNSQSKEKLTTPIEQFAGFTFKEKDIKHIWTFLEPYITESICGKLQDKSKTRVNRGKIIFKKGNDAKFAGDKKKSHECSLFIAEGDSALGLVDSGINHKMTELKKDYYGTWSIQGVCPNARKEITVHETMQGHKVIRNEKLKENKRFEELVKLIGLDYNKKYTLGTAVGDTEFKTLRYGRILVATDADTDGKGMIFGLLINFFDLFWPELVKRGYIKRFNTPIIRAYPKTAKLVVKEFYALHEFDDWVKDEFAGDNEAAAKQYTINYYKGLAGNNEDEIRPLFNKFESKLNTYQHDDEAEQTFEVYFGKDTDARKDALATPVSKMDIIESNSSNLVRVSQFLHTDVKEFQRDNIMRKIPHIIDGLVPSRRKVLFAARSNGKMSSDKIKVVNFTGYVIDNASYNHGDASLSNTIIKMAQKFTGAKNLPFLVGIGNFGTRIKGGSDAGSPRYISIKLNKALVNALFPHQDDFLLPYEFDDGNRVEPTYFVPIIPMCVLENMQIPATGWRVRLWARDITDVIKNVRNMVTMKNKKCKKLGIWMRGNNSEVRVSSDGREYMVGKYIYDSKANTITITELPLTVYNNNYIKSVFFNKEVKDKDGKPTTKEPTLIKEIKSFEDYSSYDEVTNTDEIKIVVELAPDAMASINAKYEAALKSKKSVTSAVVADKAVNKPEKSVADKKEKANEKSKSKTKSKTVDKLTSGIASLDIDKSDSIDTDKPISDGEHDTSSTATSIEAYVADTLFDPIEEFFRLRLRIDSDINVININGEVDELEFYGTIVNTWFKTRKQLYKERIERYIVLNELMIKFLENIIRFTKEKENFGITDKTPEQKFNDILEKNGYDRFNKTLLHNPKYEKASELKRLILNHSGSSYDYIIDLRHRDGLKEACTKRAKLLEKEKTDLEKLMDDCHESETTFIGQKTWLAELDVLESVIKIGLEKGWDIKKIKPKFDI
jgi:DNA gyrase/topoisomerase IV subunit B